MFTTADPAEGEAFAAARRAAFPAIEKRGSIMLEDVGVAVPQLPALLAGIEQIAARNRVEIPVVAHAGDGNTHPIVVYDAADPDSGAPGPRPPSTRSCSWRFRSAAPSPASTASAG